MGSNLPLGQRKGKHDRSKGSSQKLCQEDGSKSESPWKIGTKFSRIKVCGDFCFQQTQGSPFPPQAPLLQVKIHIYNRTSKHRKGLKGGKKKRNCPGTSGLEEMTQQ